LKEALVRIKKNLEKEDECVAVANLNDRNVAIMRGGAPFTKSPKARGVEAGGTTLNLN
jgi:hypothetical protein